MIMCRLSAPRANCDRRPIRGQVIGYGGQLHALEACRRIRCHRALLDDRGIVVVGCGPPAMTITDCAVSVNRVDG